jgi:putative aminopeptidase FrvX
MRELIEIPSPVGYYTEMRPYLEKLVLGLGYEVTYDNRDTAYIRVEGEDTSKTVCVSAHADTLGFMVRGINSDGTLRIRNLGGINFANVEGENVTLHTRNGKKYTGMLVCAHHSAHAFDDAKTMERNENTVFVLLDEDVKNADEVKALGIRNGDYVSIDPRFTMTENGYIKCRFIDNKAAMACSLAVLKISFRKRHQAEVQHLFYLLLLRGDRFRRHFCARRGERIRRRRYRNTWSRFRRKRKGGYHLCKRRIDAL